jgi:hypothetical protein
MLISLRRCLGIIPLLLVLDFVAPIDALSAQERQDVLDTGQLLNALEAAIGTVRSFEVHVHVRGEGYFADNIVTENGKPVIENGKPKLESSVSSKTTMAHSRQLFSRGWRKIVKLNPQSGEPSEILGSDNELERIHFLSSNRGSIRRAGGRGIGWGQDYQETFRTLCDGVPIILVFRERIKNVRVSREGPYVVFEVDPKGITYAGWGFRVYADPRVNFLPAKTEAFQDRDGERQLMARMTVMERKKVGTVEVPVRAVTEFFSCNKESPKYQHVHSKYELKVNVAESRWNEAIAEETFRVPFPAGIYVIDEIRDVAFVVGKPDPGKNLEELARNSKILAKNIRPVFPPPTRNWAWWIVGGTSAGVVLLALVAFLIYRRRSTRQV